MGPNFLSSQLSFPCDQALYSSIFPREALPEPLGLLLPGQVTSGQTHSHYLPVFLLRHPGTHSPLSLALDPMFSFFWIYALILGRTQSPVAFQERENGW